MANPNDLKMHEDMWHNFVKLLTYSALGVIIGLVFLAIVLL